MKRVKGEGESDEPVDPAPNPDGFTGREGEEDEKDDDDATADEATAADGEA